MLKILLSEQKISILLIVAATILPTQSCKTPSRGTNGGGAGLLDVPDDDIKLREFQHEVDQTLLKSFATRVGCKVASEFVLQPASGSMKRTIDGIYAAKAPYDYMQQELFNLRKTEQTCVAAGQSSQQSNTDGMRSLLARAQAKNIGITFLMVGGFGSHLTEKGALADSRALWEKTFAAEIEKKQFRVVRQECMPNSYADDDTCSPKLIEKFKQLEIELGGAQHRYILWGYSKGGTTILQALGTSPELREKTLAMISVGSPFGGGMPIDIAYPLVEGIAKKRSEMSPGDRVLLNNLIAFGAGAGMQMSETATAAKMAALLEEDQFNVLRGGFRSILPGVRKPFLNTIVRNWNFTRAGPDPLTGKTEVPLLHIAATLDISRLKAVPVMTVDNTGRIVPQENSQDMSQLSELAMLGPFKKHPANDSCVAMEHAVIPKNSVPKGATSTLLAILNLDHMSLGFSAPAKEQTPAPRTELVDAIIESAAKTIGVN